MSLETAVTKGFSVSLQSLLVSDVDLREKKAIKRERYLHKIGEKEQIEIYLFLECCSDSN